METVVPNWVVPACCVGLEECWIVEHAITVHVPWRNICALLMHVYLLQSELLAFLAVDIHVSYGGYDTWKTSSKKATLILLRSFNLFNLLWGLGLQIWGVGH